MQYDTLPEPEREPACKGVFMRYTETQFRTAAGGWAQRSELRPLKRLSCPGCRHCGGVDDFLAEFPDLLEFGPGVLAGDIVEMGWQGEGIDWETGQEDAHVIARKFTPGPT